MERKVCVILVAGNWGSGRQMLVQRSTTPQPLIIRAQELLQTEGGAPCRAPQSTLTLIFKFVTSSLTSIILMVSCTVSFQFQVQFISISFRPVLRIVATMSWLQSGHCVINFFHLVEISVQDSSQDMVQNTSFSP